MPTGSTTTLCFLQLLVVLQSFSASFHSSRPFPITFRKSSTKPFSAFLAQSKVQNSHIEEIVSLSFPLHNLRFLLYLLYSSFLSFLPLSEVWEWKRTTPFLSKACFFTRILIPFFSFISSRTLFHNFYPVFPLFKFFLIASAFPRSVNILRYFGEINCAVIVSDGLGRGETKPGNLVRRLFPESRWKAKGTCSERKNGEQVRFRRDFVV